MEQTNAPSTKGKGLGVAGMIIGIVALVIAVIPYFGAGALWISIVGLVLAVIAFFMAKSGNNPKKGMIMTGIILNVVALGLAIFWIWKIQHDLEAGLKDLQEVGNDLQEQLQHDIDSMQNAE